MSEIEEIIAKYILETYGSVTPKDIVNNTKLDSAHNVSKELEKMRDKDLVTKDFYKTEKDKRNIPRYYSTYELEDQYTYLV